ncbi:MAG: alpha/beta hydrolase fold domain-containing protein [Planctomycetota bacterium]
MKNRAINGSYSIGLLLVLLIILLEVTNGIGVGQENADSEAWIPHDHKLVPSLNYYRALNLEQDDYQQERCFLDLVYPTNKKNFATIVWFHAGGLVGGRREIPEALLDQGIAIVAVDYRLSPKVKAPAYIEDAAAAVAWTFKNIEEFGGSKKQIFVAGHSAGGYLTSMIGLDKRWLKKHSIDADRIAGLISYSGHAITHMTIRKENGIDKTRPVIDRWAPLFHIRKNIPPLLLISGDREKEMIGRYEESAYFWRMLKHIGNEHVQIIELKGTDHNSMAELGHRHCIHFVKSFSKMSESQIK